MWQKCHMDPLNSLEEPVDPTVHDAGETKLWRAVVLQAFVDATEPNDLIDTSVAYARDQARAWMFSVSSSVRADFEAVCDLAAMDPFAIRAIARRCLETGKRVHRATLTSALRLPEDK